MKKINKILIMIAIVVGFAVVFLVIRFTSASFNEQINYQGKLTTSAGVAVADGTYCLKFVLYDALTDGNVLWSEEWEEVSGKVTLTNGLFSVMLGSHTSISSVDFNSASRYLEVQFDPGCDDVYEEVFSPRKIMGAVPGAFEAKQLGGYTWVVPGTIGSGTPNTGAFTTLTATTSITSPKVLGGTSTTADLTLQTTSGVGDTGADMHFLVGNNGATEAMTILNSGKVGIGTASPNRMLQVRKDQDAITGVDVTNESTGVSAYASLWMSTGTSKGFGFQKYGINYSGTWDGIALADYARWRSESGVTGLIITTGDTKPIIFGINDNEEMRIHSTGKVGIGTTGPDAKLDVLSTTEQLRLTYADGTNYSSFTQDINGDLLITATGGDISFSDDNIVTTGTITAEQITSTDDINASGNISTGINSGWLQSGSTNQFHAGFNGTNGVVATAGDLYLTPGTGENAIITSTSSVPIVATGSNGAGVGIDLDATATGGEAWYILSTADAAYPSGGHLGFYNEDNARYAAVLQNNGRLYVSQISSSNADPAGGVIHGKASATTDVVLIAEGIASQSGNLQEWRTSAGTPAYVDASGNFIGANLNISNWDTAYTHSQNNSQAHTDYVLNTGDQIDGDLIIDNTSTEAFLVRKNADGGDVFVVDSTNGGVGIGTALPGQDLAGGTLDAAGLSVHAKGSSFVSWIVEGDFPLLDFIDLGGGADDKFFQFMLDSGQMNFRSLNDNGSVRSPDMMVFDMGTGGIGIGTNSVGNGVVLDITDTEAFLVRKDADGGDIFTVDTTNPGIRLTTGTIASMLWSQAPLFISSTYTGTASELATVFDIEFTEAMTTANSNSQLFRFVVTKDATSTQSTPTYLNNMRYIANADMSSGVYNYFNGQTTVAAGVTMSEHSAFHGGSMSVDTGATVSNRYILRTADKVGAGTLDNQYFLYLSNFVGATNNWALYNNTTANSLMGKDNSKSYFGTAFDASIYYDGTDLVINPKEVGSGKLTVSGNTDFSTGFTTLNYGTSAPALTTNGQISTGVILGSLNRIYFYSNGGLHYVAATAGYEIPWYESTDPISGEKMDIGDIIMGIVDKEVIEDPSNPDKRTLHGVWVKWDSVKEQLIEEIKANGGIIATDGWASGDSTIQQTESMMGKVVNILIKFGISVKDGLTTIKNLATQKFSAQTADIGRLQMKDEVTGEVYCIRINNGEWIKTLGECSVANNEDQNISPEIKITPKPEPESEIDIIDSPEIEQSSGQIAKKVVEDAVQRAVKEETKNIKQEVKSEIKEELKQEKEVLNDSEAVIIDQYEPVKNSIDTQSGEEAVVEEVVSPEKPATEEQITAEQEQPITQEIIKDTTASLIKSIKGFFQASPFGVIFPDQDLWQKLKFWYLNNLNK